MIRRITKRDGREAPFDKQKIEAAVRKAQVAVGEDDDRFCKDVADVVELALERRFPRAGEPGGAVPGIEEIQDLVEKALIDLGHAAVAKAYILYRDRRARVREALEVREERAGDPHGAAGRLRVHESGALGRWSKRRIVAALLAEADLSRALAEDVASAVEKRVFDSGLARISTSLIRELVDNELVEMGLAGALARQGPVAIARHDLRALLDDPGFELHETGSTGGGRARRRLDEALAGLVLRRFALEDVLDERSAELHLAGDLDLADLARPHADLVRALPAELVSPGRDADAAFGLVAAAAPLLREVSCGIAIEDVAVEVAALARAGELDRWVLALSAAARASGRRVDLVPFGERRVATRERAALVRLLEAQERVHAAAGPHGAATPRVFLTGTELGALVADGAGTQALLERALAAGLVVPIWERADVRFAGPGCRRGPGERGVVACSGAVALNLPRLARAAGPWREERFLEGLCDLVEHALEALAALARFQRERQALRTRDFAARSGFAVAPVGLREALRWLGDGELRAEQGARVLGVLDDALRRGARRRGLAAALTPYFGEAARARFAALDAERFQASQGLLFPWRGEPGAPGGRAAAPAPIAYSSGYDLAPPHAARPSTAPGEAEGELVATVACGALAPLPAPRPGARLYGEEHARVAAWTRFEERRGAHKGSDHDRAQHAEPVLRFDHETAAATADESTSCA